MDTKALLPALACAVGLCGCQANYYADKYRSDLDPATARTLLPHTGDPQIVTVAPIDASAQMAAYEARGYVVIGYSKFRADTDDYSAPLRQEAQAVQADLVLSTWAVSGFRNDVTAMGQSGPTINNMSNNGGYILESGGRQPASSMATPNPADNMASAGRGNAVSLSEYRAVFMRKRAVLLGTNLVALSGAEAQMENVARGLRVTSVVEGSPAARAGVRSGDILTAIDGIALGTIDEYRAVVDARAGSPVTLVIVRKGKTLSVSATLNPIPGGPAPKAQGP